MVEQRRQQEPSSQEHHFKILTFLSSFFFFFLTIFMGDDYASSSVQKLKINIHVCVCKTVKKACISEIDSNICFYFLLKSAIYLKSI